MSGGPQKVNVLWTSRAAKGTPVNATWVEHADSQDETEQCNDAADPEQVANLAGTLSKAQRASPHAILEARSADTPPAAAARRSTARGRLLFLDLPLCSSTSTRRRSWASSARSEGRETAVGQVLHPVVVVLKVFKMTICSSEANHRGNDRPRDSR